MTPSAQPTPPPSAPRRYRAREQAFKVAVGYAVLAGIWILVSGEVARLIFREPSTLFWVETYKGMFFVVVTAGLLGVALYRYFRGWEKEVAARHAAELASRAQEERLLTVTNLARVGLVIVGEGHVYRYFNRAYLDILHLPYDDLIGRRVADVLAPVYESQIRPRLEQAFAGERVKYELHVPARGPLEKPRDYAVYYEPGTDASGRVVVVVITDITESKQAETALLGELAQREHIATIATTLPGVIYQCQVTAEGKFVLNYASEALYEHLGIRSTGVQEGPDSIFALTVPEDIPALKDSILESARTLTPWVHEFRLNHPDKGQIWVMGRAIPTRDPDGGTTWHGFSADITESKRAEKEIHFQKAILEETGRIAKVGGWSFDALTGKGFWTDEVARIHDLDPADPTSRDIGLRFYTEESRRRIEAAIKAAVEEGRPYDLELELVSAKGTHKWVRTIGHPQRENGKVVRVSGSFQDITAMRHMDEARDRQQRRVAMLADISGRLVILGAETETLDNIFTRVRHELALDIHANYALAPDGRRLFLQGAGGLTAEQRQAFAEISLGESLCGLVAERREQLVLADLPRAQLAQARDIVALGVKAYAGFPLLAGDRLLGTISFGSRTAADLPKEDIRFLQAVADLVAAALERRRLLDALKSSEEKFREVVENIQEVFWVSNVEKNSIVYVSPGFETVWGRPTRSLYESMAAWTDSIHPEDRDRVLTAARTKQVTGAYDETYRILRPDGTVRWVRDRAYPVRDGAGQQVTRVVGVATDITQERELEEKYLRAQRLEAIGTLASGVAHDLNNILAPMMMVNSMLRGKLQAPGDLALLDMVERSAQRGAEVIRQLLSFSRGIGGKRMVLQPQHLLKEVGHLIEETFPRSILCELLLDKNLWNITADATQVHQVLINLCVNARDAMPTGGRLTIIGRNLELTAADVRSSTTTRPGPYVLIEIRDTGTGIPPDIQRRIFDPFFTTKPEGKGTGLGLATVLGIVQGHEGMVTVDSEVGRGTTFRVYFPACPGATGPAASPKSAAPGRGHHELLLLVEDEDPIRDALVRVLEDNGYLVLAARNGEDAVHLYLQHRGDIRLILTDLVMPVMGGLELIRVLRALNPALRFLAISGSDQHDKLDDLTAAGVDTILAKPFGPPELLAAIEQKLGAAP